MVAAADLKSVSRKRVSVRVRLCPPIYNMKTLKVKKKEFKKALNELCHKHNVIIDDSFTIVYTRKKYWDVSRVEVNTHPYKSVSDVGMKLLHK
jgi:hypothetical protein